MGRLRNTRKGKGKEKEGRKRKVERGIKTKVRWREMEGEVDGTVEIY